MSNPALVSDVEARWRPLSTDEQGVAQAWLDSAWQVVLSRVPDVESRVEAGTLSGDLVVTVLCAMVLRVVKNPEGRSSGSVTIDDGMRSWKLDSAVASGALFLTPEDLALLVPIRGGAFSIAPRWV